MFATLNEAWSDEPRISVNTSYKKNDSVEPSNITLDKGYIPPKEYYDFSDDDEYIKDVISCDDILAHLSKCESCRSKVVKKYPYNLPDNILNTLIFVIFGIFILFLIDIFVRLGKYIS